MSARVAVAFVFWMNGTFMASWLSRIPAFKQDLALSDAQLGLALFGTAVGALVAFPLTGIFVTRYGSKRVTFVAGLALCLALPLLSLAGSLLGLTLCLVVFGACVGSMDIAMNAHAAEVETLYERPIMSSFHGLWSLGGLTGAGLGGLLVLLRVSPGWHFVLLGIAFAALLLTFTRSMLPFGGSAVRDHKAFALPNRALLGLGVIAFSAFVIEGAMADWSAVYLHDVLQTTAAFAAAGYGAFSLFMMIARFGGDRIVGRFGASSVLLGSAGVTTLGLLVALTTPAPVVFLLGLAVVGAGMACVVPVALSLASRNGSLPAATAIAAVATMGYGGYLVGPPVLGVLSDWLGLRLALGLLICLSAAIMLLSRGTQPSAGPRAQQSRP